jgi:hypothetical protein
LAYITHGKPQVPQFASSLVTSVSQPVEAWVSQSPKPELHEATAQLPPVHVGVAFASEQAVPQAPQFETSASTFVSQPAASGSQSPNPLSHVMPQAESVQVAVPFVASHAVPHAEQLSGSTRRSLSHPFAAVASQSAKPVSHEIAHRPAVQLGVPLFVLHAPMQEPQCCGSVARSTSHPVNALPSQSAKVEVQLIPHTPAVQLGVPPVSLQATMQAPQ